MSPLPLYHRIYTVLAEQIREGEHAPGAALPGELELARRFGVSRVTIRHALERLEREGRVERLQGRGTFVRGDGPAPLRAEVSGLVENLLALGQRTTVEVHHFAFEPVPASVARELAIPLGSPALHTDRLRLHRDEPVSWAVTWLPEAVGRTVTAEELAEVPLMRLLTRADAAPAAAHQRVYARAADATVAPLLGVEVGAPLLGLTRTVRDAAGRPVEYIRALYRPDRHEFELTMRIKSDDPAAPWEPDGTSE